MNFQELMDIEFYGNSLMDYLVALGFIIVGLIVVKVFGSVVVRGLKRLSARSESSLDDFIIGLIDKTAMPLLYFGVLYLSLRNVVPPSIARGLYVIGVALLTVQTIRFLTIVIQYATSELWFKEGDGGEGGEGRSLKGIIPAIKVVIWGIGIIFLLDNLGFEISAIVAGFGIGGIAVAMASQAVLGDLFSYVAILTDRPFVVGDFVIVDEHKGKIEHIGIKTTRIRSIGGEQLVFSNADLTGSRLSNHKRMERRKVVFQIGVTYQTKKAQLEAIPAAIDEIITSIDLASFDRAHFVSFGDSSLNFEIAYFIDTRDYYKYMDVQQEINLALVENFEREGIDFAYPTQTLFVEGAAEGPLPASVNPEKS